MGDLSVKLKKVHVINNRSLIGTSQLYVLTTLIDSTKEKPILIAMEPFEDIRDNSDLLIGEGGLAVYRFADITASPVLDVRVTIRKSNEPVRTVAAQLADFLKNQNTLDVIDQCKKLLTANPVYSVAVEAGKVILGLVMEGLKLTKDDPLIDYVDCFEDLKPGTAVTRYAASPFCEITLEAAVKTPTRGKVDTDDVPGMEYTFQF